MWGDWRQGVAKAGRRGSERNGEDKTNQAVGLLDGRHGNPSRFPRQCRRRQKRSKGYHYRSRHVRWPNTEQLIVRIHQFLLFTTLVVFQNAGISAGKALSDAGIKQMLILEATNRIGGRMHKANFSGVSVEMGANWVSGVGGPEVNPIWVMANSKLQLRSLRSNFENISSNIHKQMWVSINSCCHHILLSGVSCGLNVHMVHSGVDCTRNQWRKRRMMWLRRWWSLEPTFPRICRHTSNQTFPFWPLSASNISYATTILLLTHYSERTNLFFLIFCSFLFLRVLTII